MRWVMPTDIFIVTDGRTYQHLVDRDQVCRSIPLSAHDAHVAPHMTAKTFALYFSLCLEIYVYICYGSVSIIYYNSILIYLLSINW